MYRIPTTMPVPLDFDTLDEAMQVCWERAKEQATDEGIDPDDLAEYEENDGSKWGVCPANNDGAYWPCVRRVA